MWSYVRRGVCRNKNDYMKIIAMHQPDFLPYSGFFYKYFKADVFDLAIYDQFSPSGYHRRVKMGGEWVTMPCKGLNKLPRETRICDIEVYRERAIAMLIGAIDRTYRNSPHYRKVRRSLVAWISDWTKNETDETMKLYLFNEMLLHWVVDYLGEHDHHKFRKTSPPTLPKAEGIVEIMQKEYPEYSVYLSGRGGQSYTTTEFSDAGLEVIYSNHEAKYSDSVLTVLMEEDDPLSVILREKIV